MIGWIDTMAGKEKYGKNDLKKIPKESRLALIGLMIANELHNIYSVSKEKKNQ